MNLQKVPKSVINLVCQLPNDYKSKILKVALAVCRSPTQDRTKSIDGLLNEWGISKQQIYEILGLYVSLIRLFTETNDKDFNLILCEIGFPLDFIENLPLVQNRKEIQTNFLKSTQTDYGKLQSLKWRLDISLSNSSLVKKVPTPVLFSITLKNGNKYVIEVDSKTFNKLRFSIALLIKELTSKRAILCKKFSNTVNVK